jgi:hypothetical protein
MKTVLEFGARGGAHTDNLIFPNAKLALLTAARLVMVLTNDPHSPGALSKAWKLDRRNPRATWSNTTHFVAVSLLDGVMRGPAAAGLWRKPGPGELAAEAGAHAATQEATR